jgi:SAM-dependent methyltransferase
MRCQSGGDEMDDISLALLTRFAEAYLAERKGSRLEILALGAGAAHGEPDLSPFGGETAWTCQSTELPAKGKGGSVSAFPRDLSEWPDATRDVIVSEHALEHSEAPWDVAREIARVLRSGGLACLIVPNAGPEHRDPVDCWRMGAKAIEALAKHAGLRLVEAFTLQGLGEWQPTFAVLQKAQGLERDARPAFRETISHGVGIRCFLEALGSRPRDACYYLGVAGLMLEDGRLAKAIAVLEAGLVTVPEHPEIRRMLSDLRAKEGQRSPELDRVVAWLQDRPASPEVVHAAADFFDRAGAIERRLLGESLQGDLPRLREIATLAELGRRHGLAAHMWKAVVSTGRGDIEDFRSWAANTRGAGSPDAAADLFRRARDLQLRDRIVNRTTVVQRLIWKLRARTYLEIGVNRGTNFFQIEVPLKFAVDPDFRIPGGTRDGDGIRFFETTSDAFFGTPPPELERLGLDVVLVDGLHTCEQAFRNICDSLRHLNQAGVIVAHDCLPASEAEACHSFEQARRAPGFAGVWTGDVFRAIVRLRRRADLFVCVLDADHGVGIVTRGTPESVVSLDESALEGLTFAELRAAPEALLNLKAASWFERWLSAIELPC